MTLSLSAETYFALIGAAFVLIFVDMFMISGLRPQKGGSISKLKLLTVVATALTWMAWCWYYIFQFFRKY